MKQVQYNLSVALQKLKTKLGFSAAVVTTMGVTLGALLCVLTLAHLLLVQPLSFPEQEKLFRIDHNRMTPTGEAENPAFPYPALEELYKQQDVFSHAAMVHYSSDVVTSLQHQPALNTAHVTPEWFDMLGVNMQLGRGFTDTEKLNSHNPVAVLTHKAWVEHFGQDPNVIGEKVTLSGVSFNIVGVFAESYQDPELFYTGFISDIFMPWDFNTSPWFLKDRWTSTNGMLKLVGKLKDDLSPFQAEQKLTPIANQRWRSEVSGEQRFDGKRINVTLTTFKDVILGDSSKTAYLLLAGVLGLVIIATVNIANLFMSRTAEQQRELAIHAVIGARKKDIFHQLLAESGILMTVSSILALFVAMLGFQLFVSVLGEVLPRTSELSVNLVTYSFAVLFALGFALFFAAISSNMVDYKVLNNALQSSGKGASFQVSKITRQILIGVQITVACTLVLINLSLLQNALDSISEPLGFTTDDISYVQLSNSASADMSEAEQGEVLDSIERELEQLPEVVSVHQSISPLSILGHINLKDREQEYRTALQPVNEGYFELVEQSIVDGDAFSPSDIRDNNKVVIVNENLAQQLSSDGKVLGRRLGIDEDEYTVVGVAQNTHIPNRTMSQYSVYTPASVSFGHLLIETREGQSLLKEDIVSVLNRVNKQYSISDYTTLSEYRFKILSSQISTASTTAFLTVLTFFLSAIGLYSVLSYTTQMRRFEIGTRLAIGAKRMDIVMMIIKSNTSAFIVGVFACSTILLVTYVGFSEMVGDYINWRLLTNALVTLSLVALMTVITCYLPLRKFINKPVIHTLMGR